MLPALHECLPRRVVGLVMRTRLENIQTDLSAGIEQGIEHSSRLGHILILSTLQSLSETVLQHVYESCELISISSIFQLRFLPYKYPTRS